jgi:hypothetical protein
MKSLKNNSAFAQTVIAGKPVMPFKGRDFFIRQKPADPSSSAIGEHYPIPSLAEHRFPSKRRN